MEPSDVMRALLDLAAEAELEVSTVNPPRGDDTPPTSALCRVRGRLWVMLSAADPVAVQLDVLAGALCEHAPELVADTWVPPAVRALLER